MATVGLDEQTPQELQSLAAACGLTPAELLKRLFPVATAETETRLTWEQVEAIVIELAFDSPSLPADFTRADIEDEHDGCSCGSQRIPGGGWLSAATRNRASVLSGGISRQTECDPPQTTVPPDDLPNLRTPASSPSAVPRL
jgi:hypothetical protein